MPQRLQACLPHFLMLLLSGALYWAASDIQAPPDRIGPDFWPKAVVGLMGLLCLVEIGKRLMGVGVDGSQPSGDAGTATSAAQPDEESSPPVQWPMLLGGTAMIAGYVAGVSWLGFFFSTLLFLCGFAWVGGFRRPLWVLALGLGGSLLTMVLFMRVAYISLPLGEGPFRSLSLALLRLMGVS